MALSSSDLFEATCREVKPDHNTLFNVMGY